MKNVVANLGLFIFGIFAAFLYLRPVPELDEANTRLIRGTLERAREIDRVKGVDSLELWLAGHDLPFRASGFRVWFPDHGAGPIDPGQKVALRIRPEEMDQPPRDRLEKQDFIPFYALEADGDSIALVADYNAWRARETRIGKWVALALCAGCVVILFRRIPPAEKLSHFRDREVSIVALAGLTGGYTDSLAGRMKTWCWAGLLIVGGPAVFLFVVCQDGPPETWSAGTLVAGLIPLATISLGAFFLYFSSDAYWITDRGVSRLRRKKVVWAIDFRDVVTAVLRVDRHENATIELLDADGKMKPLFVYPALATRIVEQADDLF